MPTEVVVKKWGNSLGVILPKEMVDAKGIKENENVSIIVLKKGDFRDIFGSAKTGESVQKLKDEARRGWERSSTTHTRL